MCVPFCRSIKLSHFQLWPEIHIKGIPGNLQAFEGKTKHVKCLPSTDQQSKWKDKSACGNHLMNFWQLQARWLGKVENTFLYFFHFFHFFYKKRKVLYFPLLTKLPFELVPKVHTLSQVNSLQPFLSQKTPTFSKCTFFTCHKLKKLKKYFQLFLMQAYTTWLYGLYSYKCQLFF